MKATYHAYSSPLVMNGELPQLIIEAIHCAAWVAVGQFNSPDGQPYSCVTTDQGVTILPLGRDTTVRAINLLNPDFEVL